MYQMWDLYINYKHPISDASLVDAAMLYYDVSTKNEMKAFLAEVFACKVWTVLFWVSG